MRTSDNLPAEVTRMITLRVPPWLHEAMQDQAHEHKTSMNRYCIQLLERAAQPRSKEDAALDDPFRAIKARGA